MYSVSEGMIFLVGGLLFIIILNAPIGCMVCRKLNNYAAPPLQRRVLKFRFRIPYLHRKVRQRNPRNQRNGASGIVIRERGAATSHAASALRKRAAVHGQRRRGRSAILSFSAGGALVPIVSRIELATRQPQPSPQRGKNKSAAGKAGEKAR